MKMLPKQLLSLSLMLVLMASSQVFAQKGNKYKVVINHEEQYSIIHASKAIPRGWKNTGESGKLKECQAYIEEVWTDMRPLSLRQKMDAPTSNTE